MSTSSTTIEGCPLKDRITNDVTAAVKPLEGVERVTVDLSPMSQEQRETLVQQLRGGGAASTQHQPSTISFPVSTSIVAIASGKGGVGKSSVTVSPAPSRRRGTGWASWTRTCGGSASRGCSASRASPSGSASNPAARGPRREGDLHGVLRSGRDAGDLARTHAPQGDRAVPGRRVLGDLDFLLCDLPPGTGDVSISLASFIPGAAMLVVTTPQEAARKVAERAGKMAERTNLRPIGVIENMSYYVCPHCGERDDIFGTGGGREAAETLGVPLIAQVPLVPALRAGGDFGAPIVVTDPDAPASIALREAAHAVARATKSKVGKPLTLMTNVPAGAGAGHGGHDHAGHQH